MSEKLAATVEFERLLRVEHVDTVAYVPWEDEELALNAGPDPGVSAEAYNEWCKTIWERRDAALVANRYSAGRHGECELWMVLPGKVTINVAQAALNDQIAMWAQRLCDTPDERVNEATTCMEEIRRLCALMEKEAT